MAARDYAPRNSLKETFAHHNLSEYTLKFVSAPDVTKPAFWSSLTWLDFAKFPGSCD